MAETLGALLEQQAGAITGREDERAQLRRLLEPDGPVVGYIHGLAGVGKTTLLHAFAADARAAGWATVELDAHTMHCTQGTVLAALAATAGSEPPALDAAAAALGARGERVLLLVDTYELLDMVDRWVCRTLVPALPAHVRVVLAGREAPTHHWRGYGPLLTVVPLANLAPDDSLALLRRQGVDERTAAHIDRIARGHPLSLQLAAWALRDRPGLALDDIAAGAVGEELARLYLDGLDADTRRALHAAALTRATTLPLLAAMLPGEDPAAAFERLRGLPFVERGADGLLVHDTVRGATAALLRAADPQEYWRLRAAAWGHLRAELRGAPAREASRYTADLLYLLEEGVRPAFFPAAAGEQRVAPAGAMDLPAIERLAGAEAAVARAWFDAAPGTFLVSLDGGGAIVGFACLAEPSAVSPRVIDRDPLAARWRAHLRREPCPRSQRTLFLRWLVGDYQAAVSALVLDVTRTYVEMRPELRRVYGREVDLRGADGSCALAMGYLPLDGEPDSVCMDLGPASVDGWLAEMGARERLEAEDGAEPDGLTPLEAQVLAYLRSREGQAVERAALLRDVWGYEWTGGSNVVEVVISALRRKLGADAGAIGTVRGVGYRYARASSTML